MRALLLLLALAIAARAAGSPPGTRNLRSLERQLHALINRDRKANGSPPVRLNESLSEVARRHCRDMLARRFFGHLTPEGVTPLQRLLAARIPFEHVGENLALDREIERPHRTMMAEPPGRPNHRTTLLNPRYTDVGIGIVADGEWLYIVEDFITAGSAGDPQWDGPGQIEGGLARLTSGLNALSGTVAGLHERLGRIALLTGDTKTAEDSFRAALREDPRCGAAHAGLGELHERLGQQDAAREAYARALASDPDDLVSRLRLAELALAAGHPAEAEPHFLTLTRVDAANAPAWYGAARCAAAAGRLKEARRLLRRATDLSDALRERARADPALAPLLE